MIDEHRMSEELAAQAAVYLQTGRPVDAREFYGKAAALETQALALVGADQVRTRSALAVSAASLCYKAQLYDEAELAIFRSLGRGDLLPWAQAQLRELLDVVQDERIVVRDLNRRYSGISFTVVLRGGEIGSGTGPLDLVLEKASAFRNLLYRFAEWVGSYPLRIRGAPPKDLADMIYARAAQPAPGSYRLELRLTEPLQPDLFAAAQVEPIQVSDAMFGFMTALNLGRFDELSEMVPEPGYREALLKLTRNIAPSGKRVKEIGIYRPHRGAMQAVYLTDAVPGRVKEALPHKEKREEPRRDLQGVLRALHLDENWLELTLDDGTHEKCSTFPDMLDDVVGPMVNRRVRVSGPVQRGTRGGTRLLVEDIELAED